MSSRLYLIAAILFACESCFAQTPSSGGQVSAATNADSTVKLEDSTPVILRTKQELSSATARVGDQVPFRVVEDVKVGNLTVIRRGADAWGQVTVVQPKKHKGRSGNLEVAIQSVQLLTGENASLRAEERSKGKSKSGQMKLDMAQLAVDTAGLALPLVPLLLLEKGGDAYLPVGSKVTAYLNSDIALDRVALERAQPAPAQLTGPAMVTIFRAATMGTAYRPSVYCGKVTLARLPSSTYFKIQLPAGKYSFWSNDEQIVEVHLEEGQELYLQLQMVFHGFGAKGHLVEIASSDGEYEVGSLRRLEDKEVTKVSDTNLTEFQAGPKK